VTQNERPAEPSDAVRDETRADERKERVLHTRVPAVLEEELKRLATSLRVPVSNLVRAILEDAVEAADLATQRAEDELRGFTERLASERERLRARVVGAGRARGGADEAQRGEGTRGDVRGGEARGAGEADDRGRGESATHAAGGAAAGAASPGHTTGRAREGDPFAGVLGFQQLLLAGRAVCARCGRALAAGEEVLLGVRDDGGPRVIVGRECRPGG
jgi:hypothetical protein